MKAEQLVYMAGKREKKMYLVLKSKFLVLYKSGNIGIHKVTQVLFKNRNTARAFQ